MAARERRPSRTSALSPYLARKALTSSNAACGLSGCTGRAAYSRDSGMTVEQPPRRPNKQGRCYSAAAGVASSISKAITMLCCNISPVSLYPQATQERLAKGAGPAHIHNLWLRCERQDGPARKCP